MKISYVFLAGQLSGKSVGWANGLGWVSWVSMLLSKHKGSQVEDQRACNDLMAVVHLLSILDQEQETAFPGDRLHADTDSQSQVLARTQRFSLNRGVLPFCICFFLSK